jgi:hypothetical protein
MKLKSFLGALAFLLILGSMRAEASAQSTVSVEPLVRIKGAIVDWQDARIVNASVLIEGKDLRREVTSGETVEFTVELPKGIYRVKVSHPIFKTYVIKKLKVYELDAPVVRIKLQVKMALASGGKCPKGRLCL